MLILLKIVFDELFNELDSVGVDLFLMFDDFDCFVLLVIYDVMFDLLCYVLLNLYVVLVCCLVFVLLFSYFELCDEFVWVDEYDLCFDDMEMCVFFEWVVGKLFNVDNVVCLCVVIEGWVLGL